MIHPAVASAREAVRRLRARFFWVPWVERWGVSAASVLSGLATLVVFRRGLEYFPWFLGYLLLCYLAAVVFAGARESLASRGQPVLARVVDYTVQTLLHGLLLFLLPIYFASATVASPNIWFVLALFCAATLTAVDPWYQSALLRGRWIELGLFGLGLFGSLNVAFPLVGVQSLWGLLLAGAGSMLALTPVFRRVQHGQWRSAVGQATLAAVLVGAMLWWGRDWIPPVPLHLSRGTFAHHVSGLEPVNPVERIDAGRLREWGRLTAFASIVAPTGLREPVVHVWLKDGTRVARMPVAVVTGGRPGGFRTYSWKRDLGQDPAGVWEVEIRTAHDRLIGRIRAVVTPD